MSNLRTLNEPSDLKNSRFGRPHPRHGLKLLYWFANEFMFFNNNNKMCWQYNPKYGFYGFHRFNNRKDKNGVQLLPDVNLVYYMVGNLNSEGADEFPSYVLEDYSDFNTGNNTDRIIVSIDGQCFERVYVTEHSDRTDFNKDGTYCIGKELIMIMRDLTLDEFLSKTGYSRPILSNSQKTQFSWSLVDHSQARFLGLQDDPSLSTEFPRLQDCYRQKTGFPRSQVDRDQRPGFPKSQVDWDQRPGFPKSQVARDQRPGFPRSQVDRDQRTGFPRSQVDRDQRTGFPRSQVNRDQRTGFPKSQVARDQRPGFPRSQVNRDQRPGGNTSENTETSFGEDNDSTKCCRCVIL